MYENNLYDFVDENINVYSQGKRVNLFGAGLKMEEFLLHTKLQNLSSYIFDNNKAKGIMGQRKIQLAHPAELKALRNEWFLVASSYENEILTQLQQQGCDNVLSLNLIKSKWYVQESIRSSKIKTILLESTNQCNARCSFCINPTMKRSKTNMKMEIFSKAIEKLIQEGIQPETFRLHCSGEPLIDPMLFEKIRILKRQFPESEVGFTTNFSITNERIIEDIFLSRQDYIIISLNSLDANRYNELNFPSINSGTIP